MYLSSSHSVCSGMVSLQCEYVGGSSVPANERKLPALVTAVRFLSSVSTLVDSQDVLISKVFPTLVTATGFLSCVDVLMSTVRYWWKEGFLTLVGFLSTVDMFMILMSTEGSKDLSTMLTRVDVFFKVDVYEPGKHLIDWMSCHTAHSCSGWSQSSVDLFMYAKAWWRNESFITVSAVVRFLSSVSRLVNPQVLSMSESFPVLVTVVRMSWWFLKLSDQEKAFPHWSQLKGFSPVWMRSLMNL